MSRIVECLAQHGIRLRSYQVGDHYTTCPECSEQRRPANRKKPCLSVKIDDGGGAVWRCAHCEWAGNVPQERYGRDGQPYRQERPAPAPRRPPPPKATPRPKGLLDYFAKRGISEDTVTLFGVYLGRHFFPQPGEDGQPLGDSPCIVFPYRRGGVVVNNKYRHPAKHFVQDKDAERTLFNVDSIIDDDVVIWVEGEIDVMTLVEAGYTQVVSLPDGAPQKLKDEPDPADKRFLALANCADKLDTVKRVILATDSDGPGQNLAEELARRLGKDRCWRVRWPEGCKDPNEVLVQLGADELRRLIEAAEPYPIVGLYQVQQGALLRHRRQGKVETFSTGWPAVDELFRVPAEGRLFVVTGVPNHGKSEWVDALLVNTISAHGWHAVICSPENLPIEEHAAKLAEKWAGEPFRDWAQARAMDDFTVMDAERWLAKHFAFVLAEDEAQALTLDYVLDRARHAILRHGSRWLVIDPWNELEHQRPREISETEYIGASLGRLRKFAAHHGCNVVLIAHPMKMQRAKDGTVEPPGGYDISGSANWANKPDFGITIHRPDMTQRDVEVIAWKVRFKHHGKRGKTVLTWQPYSGRYVQPGHDQQPVEEPSMF